MSERRKMTCGNTKGAVGTIKQNVEGFVRRIDFEPGHDCMQHHGDAAGRRCHGRHGMNLRFLLINEAGAVQFLMYASDWLPGSIEHGSTRKDLPLCGVMAADLGYHWTHPTYDEQDGGGTCDYLEGAPCWYDGSGLNADPVLAHFLNDGLDAVWADLEEFHRELSESASPGEGGRG